MCSHLFSPRLTSSELFSHLLSWSQLLSALLSSSQRTLKSSHLLCAPKTDLGAKASNPYAFHREDLTHRSFYTQQAFTQRSFFTEKFLHTASFYTEKLLHTASSCTEKLLHRSFYTQQAFTQRSPDTEKHLHRAFTHRSINTQEAFTQRSFYARSFYTRKLLHAEASTQRSFYTEKLLHTQAFSHNGARRCSSKTGSRRQSEKTILKHFLKGILKGKSPAPKLRKSVDKSLSQAWWSHSNTIYDVQLRKTIVLRTQPPLQATLTQPLQCYLQRLTCKHTKELRTTATQIAAPKPDPKQKKRFSAKIEKICWQIIIASLMQPLQYDLRCPAAKDNSITHAAAAPSNCRDWAAKRNRTTRNGVRNCSSKTGSRRRQSFFKKMKRFSKGILTGKLPAPKLRKSVDKSLSQPWCSHFNTIYDVQLQKTIVLRTQPRRQATLTQPSQCHLQRQSCKTK